MKKTVITKIIVLVAVLVIAATAGLYLYWKTGGTEEAPSSAPSTTPAQTQSTDAATFPTETEPVETEPPQTQAPETEPTVMLEMEDSWNRVLYDHTISAREYFVYDMEQDRYKVRTSNVDAQLYPASITKLFTSYVALECLPADTQITVGDEIELIDKDSSTAKLEVGDTLTVEQLVGGMLLPSGNDAAYTLAAGIGRILAEDPAMAAEDAVGCFIDRMNQEAERLGLENSHFVTPDGIHDDAHYISVQDFITVSRLALEDPVISAYVGMPEVTVTTAQGKSLTWKNSNLLLWEEGAYYCSYAVGLKTGYTTPAGYCLLSCIQVGNRSFLIGVFGCEYGDARFLDTLMLLTQTYGLRPVYMEEPTEETTAG